MAFDSSLLHYFVHDALQDYSQNFQIVDRANPVTFVLNGIGYSAHVSFVHDSGNARSNDDETRIQISRGQIDLQAARSSRGERVVFVGFAENGRFFTAWDPDYVFSLKAETVVSVYARTSMMNEALTHGGAARRFRSTVAGTSFLTLTLPSTAFGFYLENRESFHQLEGEDDLRETLRRYADALEAGGGNKGQVLEADQGGLHPPHGRERQKFTYQRTAYPRDPRFASEVLEAYGNSCCICGKQLSIVQAAHIVPHAFFDAEDSVRNGLALCIEHHRLYDDALLLPAPNGELIVNESRARYLKDTQRSAGLDEVFATAVNGYRMPKDPANRPSDEHLKRGLEIRLGN